MGKKGEKWGIWNWGQGTASDTRKDCPRAEKHSFSAEKVRENGKKWQKMGGKWENGKCHINK